MEEWVAKSRPVITNILRESIPKNISEADKKSDQNTIGIIVNDANMQYWVIAFTHMSVDPNPSSNYEPFEILGDKVLGLNFTQIVQQAYRSVGKEAEPGRITELLSDIMNSKFQEKLSEKWGLIKLLLINAPTVKKTGSDVFEAFFGMLSYIGDLMGRGVGYIWTFNVLHRMLSNIDFVNHVIEQPKVFINEVFTKYGSTDIKPYTIQNNDIYEASFTIPEALSVQLGLTKTGAWKQIKQVGKTKRMADDNAYRNLATEMKKRGVTTRGEGGSIFKNLWNNPRVIDTYKQALGKGEYMDFKINSYKVVNGSYIQLIGIDSTNYMTVIYSKDYPTPAIDPARAKELLLGYVNL